MGTLYLVPTPIGHLKDITFRAVEVLNQVDLILAEDTRTSGKLLKHYQIKTPMQSHHMHNEHKIMDRLIARLASGDDIAVISDAGTPAISDPGFLLTRAAVAASIRVECLPGATAFVPAQSIADYRVTDLFLKAFCQSKKDDKPEYSPLLKKSGP